MSSRADELVAWCRTFRLLFDSRPAQVALLNQQGEILETNKAWREFGRANGLSDQYESVGQNYLQACDRGAEMDSPGARDACIGLLEVLHAQRPKFTMVYPCHSPQERRWYRMWVEPQLPDIPAVVVAHYRQLQRPLADSTSVTTFGTIPARIDTMQSAPADLPGSAKNNVWIPDHCR